MKKTLIALALMVSVGAVMAECYSDGVRVGTVQKFSQKGFVNKSWEGELVMEGVKISGNSAGVRGGDVWRFSVVDPAVAKVIDESTMSGAPLAVRYCQANPLLNPLTRMTSDTAYRITQAVIRK